MRCGDRKQKKAIKTLVKPEFFAVPLTISSHPSLGLYESSPSLGATVCMTESEGDETEK